jgi:hypothetical protein
VADKDIEKKKKNTTTAPSYSGDTADSDESDAADIGKMPPPT